MTQEPIPKQQQISANDLIAALHLPTDAMLNQRVPKKLLLQANPNRAGEKRLLQEQIEEITWVASLKPGNVAIPAYHDAQRSYLELAVLSVVLRHTQAALGKAARLAASIHAAIPYPLLLLLQDSNADQQSNTATLHVSTVHLKNTQSDKPILDGELIQIELNHPQSNTLGKPLDRAAFLAAMALEKQARSDLYASYQGWFDALSAWQIAQVTGCYQTSATAQHAATRRAAWLRLQHLQAQMARLRASAQHQRQIAQQVALNLEIQALQTQYQKTKQTLQEGI